MAASSVQRVIYCDFHFQQAQITPQVKAFLQELAQVTGWSLLFVEQQQVWSDGKRLGALPRAGSWQEQIQYALTLSDPQMVFIWFDDLVAKPWHRGKVARLFDQAERLLEREQPTPTDYVRLNPNPPVTGLPMADKKFRLIGSNEAYMSSLPASIWNAAHLRESINLSGSVWSLEWQPHRNQAVCHIDWSLRYYNTVHRGRPDALFYGWHLGIFHFNPRFWAASLWRLVKNMIRYGLYKTPRFYHFWVNRRRIF